MVGNARLLRSWPLHVGLLVAHINHDSTFGAPCPLRPRGASKVRFKDATAERTLDCHETQHNPGAVTVGVGPFALF